SRGNGRRCTAMASASPRRYCSGSDLGRCLGRRRYTVGGTSTLGGFRGIGFRGRAGWRARFLGTGGSVLRGGERGHARLTPGEAVHLHAAPRRPVERAQYAVVDGPAPAPNRPV